MKVLVVGAGIAGPTVAYWLARGGHDVTVVEQAHRLRRGGYLVDFWGAGFDVAERMGIVPRIREVGYHVREAREVSRSGNRIAHFDPRRVFDQTGGRFVSIGRSDLSEAIFAATEGDVEIVFGTTVNQIHDDGDRVLVEFSRGPAREFDLVVGADGLHSRVRELVFGPERAFEHYLGITVAAFDLEGYRPRDELVAVMHTQVGLQALRLSLRDDLTMFCFMFRHAGEVPVGDVAAQKQLLRVRLGGVGWEVPAILERLAGARTFYLDRASQIVMKSWSHRNVVLIGDAAACPSLLAGQGSALAMVGAYVLAAELQTPRDRREALAAYHGRLSHIIQQKQKAARGLGAAFAPRNRAQLILRNSIFGAMSLPLVADLAMGRSMRDPIELPPQPRGSADEV